MIRLQDRYKFEKHYVRRRIQVLREQVLLRKFGYLFFRKTISKILPSTATNFYLKNKLKNAFKKIEMNWYEGRVEWKHNLRAELHSNFVLKKRTFQRLAMFYVKKKTKRVKTTIAEIMFEKNFKKRILKSNFDNWKNFASMRKTEKLKEAVADQFFKANFQIKRIRSYFTRWKLFIWNRKALNLKIEEAFRFYIVKLKSRVFNAFFSYIIYKRMRRDQIERASLFYSNKLKEKMFNKLMSFKMHKSFQRDKIEFANNFYRKKLLRRSMNSFWRNLERRLYKKERSAIFVERKCKRMKKYYFHYWRKYVGDKKIERRKYSMAIGLYEIRCKKKIFRKLKIYRLYKKRKREYQSIKLLQIKSIFERRILIICFNSWRSFTYNKIIKKERFQLAQVYYDSLLKKLFFHIWLDYKNYKKMRKRKMIESELYFYRKSLYRNFNKWRNFTCEQRKFALKKVEAKNYYQHCLIRQTFQIMIKSAFREKDEKLNRYLENEKKCLLLAQKYGRIWRMKTKHFWKQKTNKIYQKENIEINSSPIEELFPIAQKRDNSLHSFVDSLPESFVWDPMCFARPRVPDYMKNFYESL